MFAFFKLADGGDFLDLLQAEGALTEKRARYFYVQYGDAYRYMHNMVSLTILDNCTFYLINL